MYISHGFLKSNFNYKIKTKCQRPPKWGVDLPLGFESLIVKNIIKI